MAALQRFLGIINGNRSEVVPTTTGGATKAGMLLALDGTTGLLDPSVFPASYGPDAQNFPATENITGPLVNVYNSGTASAPVTSIRNADGSVTGKEANGYVNGSVAQGANANVFDAGLISGASGLTIGPIYLSDTTPGAITSTPPTVAGHVLQRVGTATSATTAFFAFGEPITRA